MIFGKTNAEKWTHAEQVQRNARTSTNMWRMNCTAAASETDGEGSIRWTAVFQFGAGPPVTLTLHGYGVCPYVVGTHHHLHFKPWPE